jgi:hypothetical protein
VNNRKQREQRANRLLMPPGYNHPDTYTERELHQRLVTDATKHIATPLAWAVAAYERIGQLNGRGADQAIQQVMVEVYALTGHGMPVA